MNAFFFSSQQNEDESLQQITIMTKVRICTPTPTCLLILVDSITFFSSHMSKRIISFSIRMFSQLSPKWLWHSITEHQRQIKEPMPSLLLPVLYDMLSLWSKLALLSGIFHLKRQLKKKLQSWDKRSLFFWEGRKNPPPLNLEILAFSILMRFFKDPFSVDAGGNCAVTAKQYIPPLDVDDKFQ